MRPEDFIIHESFDTADALLDALARRNSRWGPDPTNWIYRGHADADWKLLPNAFRPNVYLDVRAGSEMGPRPDYRRQVEAEFELIRAFLSMANAQGHRLPAVAEQLVSDPGSVTARFQNARMGFEVEWPLPELQPLFALAQHHEVPTRLLDWSGHPLKAIYFAAEKAAKWAHDPKNTVEHLAVWAFSIRITHWPLWGLGNNRVRIVTALGAENPNLHAQSGLFTVTAQIGARWNSSPTFPPLDEFILEELRKQRPEWLQNNLQGPAMYKMTLPVSEAPRLLRLLYYEGIAGHLLFPGLDGVVKGLREFRLWDTPR